jgi:hypothetical protein
MAKKSIFTAEEMENINKVLRASGSNNRTEGLAATHELAKALELPLRQAILSGDILDGIFEQIQVGDTNSTAEFPLDIIAPGMEKDFVAYTIPKQGYIPQRTAEADYVMVPTYPIGNSIDWGLRFARDARMDVIGRCLEVYKNGFVKKLNDDGWHTILASAVDRNIVVVDSDSNPGQFTKRLVSLGKTVMRRNGGGNSSSANRGKLTDLYISPEAMEDIRNWNVDQVDEQTRREIFLSEEGTLNRIFGVNLHDVDELGEGQEYQLYTVAQLSVSMPSSKVELAVGLDLGRKLSFVMPIRSQLETFEDDTLHRQQRGGIYGWQEQGFAALDNRTALLLAL